MAPPQMQQIMEGAIKEVENTGILDRALNVGDKAPDFELSNPVGTRVRLSDLLAKGPVILTWYRGNWCPYCNIQLRDYQKSLSRIKVAGSELVAISPETPDNALTMEEKNALKFTVLSDIGNKVARKYGIVYKVPQSLEPMYGKGGRIDLPKYNGDDSLELLLAVTYVVDRKGIIRYAYVDSDYRNRAETSEVIAAALKLGKK